MDYYIFKKPTKSGNKIVHRWYSYYQDPVTGKKIQKVCKGCKNQAQVFEFISSLPSLYQCNEPVVISQIARFMYVPGSDHVTRLEKLGKKLDIKTLKEKRFKLKLFVKEFGIKGSYDSNGYQLPASN